MIYLNKKPLNVTMFPDNTSQVWKIEGLEEMEENFAYIKWVYSNEAEFMHLAQLKTLLDHHRIDAILSITYLPYGRQDKFIDNKATFALRTFANLINAMNFKTVFIQDPHSKIALKLINNSIPLYPIDKIEKIIKENDSTLICYPDKGARTKYTKEYEELNMPYIYGNKVRDQATGHITSYELVGSCAGENVLIVDDICDGGATFQILAKDLLANGANSVVLFVTHGIFSKGVRCLLEAGINRVYAADGEKGARSGSFQL